MNVYATREDDGARVLVEIQCDAPGCAAKIKPRPDIAQSGWMRYGQDDGLGTTKLEWDYCPDHAEARRA